jgi:hypothetical protein
LCGLDRPDHRLWHSQRRLSVFTGHGVDHGVIASVSVTVVPETGGIADPRITYWYRAVAGGVQIKVFNGTGTNIDFSVETFAITVLRVA